MKQPYTTTTSGARGWFAVLMVWDNEGGLWDVWQTGIGSYATQDEAEQEAKEWADAEAVEYRSGIAACT